MHLVVGGDSLVGAALAAHLRGDGKQVVTTTRRHDAVDQHLHLDLAADPDHWRWPREVEVAYLCAGVTRIDACEKDPAGSAHVNVSGVAALASRLTRKSAFVIYLSTNQVFDGSIPHQQPDAPYSPTTEYGRQKAAAEKSVLAAASSVAVVRFTKIFPNETPLIVGWRRSLEAGQVIRPFSDVVMAPLPVQFCVEVLRRIGEGRATGITQVSGDRDVSYAEAGQYVGRRLGSASELVRPQRSDEAGVSLGPPRPHTTLDTERLRNEFEFDIPSVWETIDHAMGATTCA